MKRTIFVLISILVLLTMHCMQTMASSVILAYGQWENVSWTAKGRYVAQGQQGPDGAWYSSEYDDSAWDDVSGPLGSNSSFATYWKTNYSSWYLRRHFTLENVDSNHEYSIVVTHDDECHIYLNGVEVYHNSQYMSSQGQSKSFVLTDKALEALKVGDNVLAVSVSDILGYEMFIDFGLYDNTIETDAEGYYLLSSAKDWKSFTSVAEKMPTAKARMTADIDLCDDQTMIGSTTAFQGIFDGQGHTLNVNYYSTGSDLAPFRKLQGATVERLHVTGKIESTYVAVGGISAFVRGEELTTIRDCWSSVYLVSGTGGIGNTIGGLVSNNNGNLTIEDCLFDGRFADKNTRFNAGFVSNNTGTLTIRNSLNIGTCHSQPTYYSGTFYRPDVVAQYGGKVTLENVYYKNACGTAQGTQVTDTQLFDGTVTTWLQNGRFEERWKQGESRPVPAFADYPDLPLLQVSLSKAAVTEGETFMLTVSVEQTVAVATSVQILSEHPARFNYPQTAVIQAGEKEAAVSVTAIDDDVPGLDFSSIFTAYIKGYERGEAIVLVNDDDLPALELTLTPNCVKEADGPMAVAATLRRTTATESKITVRLSDDSDGGLYLGQTTLELAKGVQEAHFSLGPVDNGLVDGDRTYTVTAAVWLSSCSCSAKGQAAGSVEARLQVYDDDGPALTLTAGTSAVKEGGTVTLTVKRNTATDSDLTLTLGSNHDNLLTYDHTVTIPAGSTEATVNVQAAKNDLQDDSQTVVFIAQAEGYGSGTCWLMITDQTLPDARIASLTADKEHETVSGSVVMTVVVNNDGAAALPSATSVKVYRRGSASPVTTLYTQAELAPGEQETLSRAVTLPLQTGVYAYYAVVNEADGTKELSMTNNTSNEVKVTTSAPYVAIVETDQKVYKQGETVTISGQLTGTRTAGVESELYIISDGARHAVSVTTDSEGRFTYTWLPYTGQMGHIGIGACYPGEGLTQAMASIDIYGLRRQGDGNITCDVTVGSPYTGSITLLNPGTLPLTGIKVEVEGAPAGCNVKAEMPQTISGRQTAELKYTITGDTPTAENAWQKIRLKVQTAEGVSMEQTLYYYCRPLKAQLVACDAENSGMSGMSINTTMTKGKEREYMFYVTNIGRGSSGTVTLSLPSWMKSASGISLAPLAQNDTAAVVLRLLPTDEMQLNVPVEGYLGINCQNGSGTRVSFSITPVSEATGTLTVDVCDENTYDADFAPHVEGAEVVVRNPVTQALMAQGQTGADGIFSLELPEGYYQLSVSASGHDAYMNNILVSPGTETWKTINLSIKGIDVSFGVKEIELTDTYEVTTTFTYQTNVPVPVVLLEVPARVEADKLQPGESLIFNATLTNKGLITAKDASLLLPTGFTHLTFEPLSAYEGLNIAPGQTVTIPVLVTRVNAAGSRHRREYATDNDPCVGQPGTIYHWDCGNDRKWHRYGVALQLGSCDSNDPSSWNPYTNPTGPSIASEDDWHGGWPEGTSLPNPPNTGEGYLLGSSSGSSSVSSYEDKGCEPCQNEFMRNVLKCIPVVGEIYSMAEDIGKALSDGNKCLRAATRDIELVERLRLCPFTDDFVEPVELMGSLYRLLGTMANGDFCNSEMTAEDFDRIDKAVDEALDDINESLRGKMAELAGMATEEAADYLDNKYPGVRRVYDEAQKLKERLRTFASKGKKVVNSANKLSKTDKADIASVYEATLGLCDALGSLLTEIPTTKKIGKNMQSTFKKLNKMKCWVDMASFKCEKEGEAAQGRLHAKSTGNSLRDSFIEAMSVFTDMVEAGDAIKAEVFDDSVWMNVTEEELLPLYNYLAYDDRQNEDMARYILKPQNVTYEQFDALLERWHKIFDTSDGYVGLLDLNKTRHYMDVIDEGDEYLRQSGFDSFTDLLADRYNRVLEAQERSSVCASVKLAIPQTLAMTRQAFRGTLTIYNGHEDTAMKDVRLTLLVTSEDGLVATSHEFQINAETLTGFNGELDLDSGWMLDAQQTGVANILFIPTQYAAPEKPVKWSFGGVLAYKDPFSDLEVRRELYPVTLTVSPSPVLDLTYFMQRDILGDDPLTPDVKEPTAPAEFALIISNKGGGEARNVRMTTKQPQIIENEKGLAAGFSIISSSLNGLPATLSFGETVQNDFGTIAPGTTAYAQWWMTDSLLGHFTEYDATVNHLTSYGNPDLSLIDQFSIHELIHGFTPMTTGSSLTADVKRAWLVNDIADADDMPDAVYFSDATNESTSVATADIEQRSGLQYLLTITPPQQGWSYGSVASPVGSGIRLAKAIRMSDEATLPLDNVWQTDRTLRDGREWLYENRIHFVGHFAGGSESYLLTFTALDGDVNGDGVIDVADIASIISVMAGHGSMADPVNVHADVDGNGVVDVTDIATVISLMAGQESVTMPTPTAYVEKVDEDKVTMTSAEITYGFANVPENAKCYVGISANIQIVAGDGEEISKSYSQTFSVQDTKGATYEFTGLYPSTTYTYYAYVEYEGETWYSDSEKFTTKAPPTPVATTGDCSKVTTNSATVSCSFENIPEGGVCGVEYTWSNGSKKQSIGNANGTQTITLSGLEPGMTYSYCAYVEAYEQTYYGEDKIFTTKYEIPDITGTWQCKDYQDGAETGSATFELKADGKVYRTNTSGSAGSCNDPGKWSINAEGRVYIYFEYVTNSGASEKTYTGTIDSFVNPSKIEGSSVYTYTGNMFGGRREDYTFIMTR